ncbi:polyprenyl synthetase family protein [soil metagenome]
MTFEQALERAARDTAALLDTLLPDEPAPAPRLIAAMRYAVLGPGKRLRPFFVIESAALFDVPRERAVRAGTALEALHCYSLVHDDLPAMDDDDLRRGQPTVHVAFDEATAILAGDALLTLAFEILASPATHPDAVVRCALISGLAQAAGKGGMAAGQMLDLDAERLPRQDMTAVARIQSLKTGALFEFACAAGALLGGAAPSERDALASYARASGLAFQIADDLLDAESETAAIGKTAGKDRERGKATLVDLLGVADARRRARDLIDEALAALAPFGERAAVLREAALYLVNRQR